MFILNIRDWWSWCRAGNTLSFIEWDEAYRGVCLNKHDKDLDGIKGWVRGRKVVGMRVWNGCENRRYRWCLVGSVCDWDVTGLAKIAWTFSVFTTPDKLKKIIVFFSHFWRKNCIFIFLSCLKTLIL